jgi:4-carboxymuconolactone decarboxylase
MIRRYRAGVTPHPRLRPLSLSELDEETARLTQRAGGGGPTGRLANVVATMAHHPVLFRRWLQTGSALYPGSGRLSARDSELLVLRTAAAMRNRYEWEQHASSGRGNLSDEEIARVLDGPGAPGWSDQEAALLRAADELVETAVLCTASWEALRQRMDDAQMLEVMFLVGTYRLLAGLLDTVGVEPDEGLQPAAPAPPEWTAR